VQGLSGRGIAPNARVPSDTRAPVRESSRCISPFVLEPALRLIVQSDRARGSILRRCGTRERRRLSTRAATSPDRIKKRVKRAVRCALKQRMQRVYAPPRTATTPTRVRHVEPSAPRAFLEATPEVPAARCEPVSNDRACDGRAGERSSPCTHWCCRLVLHYVGREPSSEAPGRRRRLLRGGASYHAQLAPRHTKKYMPHSAAHPPNPRETSPPRASGDQTADDEFYSGARR
jgi:hypothetical protein